MCITQHVLECKWVRVRAGLCGQLFMLRRAFQNAGGGGAGNGVGLRSCAGSGLERADSVPGPSHVQMPQSDSWTGVGILSNPLTQHQKRRLGSLMRAAVGQGCRLPGSVLCACRAAQGSI